MHYYYHARNINIAKRITEIAIDLERSILKKTWRRRRTRPHHGKGRRAGWDRGVRVCRMNFTDFHINLLPTRATHKPRKQVFVLYDMDIELNISAWLNLTAMLLLLDTCNATFQNNHNPNIFHSCTLTNQIK